jgi:hypothetical protein
MNYLHTSKDHRVASSTPVSESIISFDLFLTLTIRSTKSWTGIQCQRSDPNLTLEIKGSRDLISANRFKINGYAFRSRWGIWDSIMSAHHRIHGQGRFSPARSCSCRNGVVASCPRWQAYRRAVAGLLSSDGCCEAMDEMSLWLMVWCVMVACIYIG